MFFVKVNELDLSSDLVIEAFWTWFYDLFFLFFVYLFT